MIEIPEYRQKFASEEKTGSKRTQNLPEGGDA
jgi:hypothetical protein